MMVNVAKNDTVKNNPGALTAFCPIKWRNLDNLQI